MPLSSLVVAALAAALAWSGACVAQASVHSYLQDRMHAAAVDDRLPVYFVLRDRLEYEHWFPRVDRLPIDQRRAVVLAELRAHATRTQRRLRDAMRDLQAMGEVDHVVSNWLGNFVHCDATPAAITALAAFPDVAEVRYKAAWPIDQVEDGAVVAVSRELAGAAPANGPINTRADQVWALGFEGAGVVVMNADSGIALDQGDLRNRLWVNPGEIPGNGVDDDNNGYVDDVHGWNFFSNNNSINESGSGHGAGTAGCLVGDGSCSGTITGQAPGAKVMTARLGTCCPQNGPVNPAGEVAQWDAIQYAIQMGAHVQTSSHSYKNGFVPPPDYRMHRYIGDTSLAAGLIRTNSPSNNGAECFNATHLARRPFNCSAPGNLPPPYLDPHQRLRGRKSGVIGCGAHDVASNQRVSYSPCGPFAWYLPDLLAVNPSYPVANWTPSMNDYPWQGGAQQGLLKPDLTGPTGTTTTGNEPCALRTFSGTSNATPNVAGCMVLWKGANMSLKPEDTAMIAHQTAAPSSRGPGKFNNVGAGRVDALAGLHLALCVHRVNGEPAWSVQSAVGNTVTLELDGVPNSLAALVLGTARLPIPSWGGVVGVGGTTAVLWQGRTDGNGDATLSVAVPAALAGVSVLTQGFVDGSGVTGTLLSSNVIETRFVR